MALEGRLSEFTLEEILQLIALQQKTGVLTVDASYPMVLYFENGELLSYRDRRGAAPDPLQGFLKNYGFFTGENWEHLEFIQRNSDLDFTEILINEGHLSPDELTRVQHDAAQEHIYRGMLLRDGRYHFAAGRNVLKGVKGRVRIKVEGLLMEAARRIDEVSALHSRYGDRSSKIKRTEQLADDGALSNSMRHLLAVVGAENGLDQVIARAKMSEFDCLQTLEMLRDIGLVVVLARPVVEPVDAAEEFEEDITPRRSLAPLLWAFGAVALLAGLILLRPLLPYSELRTAGVERGENFTMERELGRLHAALHTYAQAKGHYPQRLNQLLDEGLLPANVDVHALASYDYQSPSGGGDYRLKRQPVLSSAD